MTAIVLATQLDQSILAIWCWSMPKATMDALKATRYCFASVNQRMITLNGELLAGSLSFFARGDTGFIELFLPTAEAPSFAPGELGGFSVLEAMFRLKDHGM